MPKNLPHIKSHIYQVTSVISPSDIQDGQWQGLPVVVEPVVLSQAQADDKGLLAYPDSRFGNAIGSVISLEKFQI
ncbi:MAG: hypothetical protein VKL20_06555 [Synechocystis sp.]|nr:hypothetical protein [Synechocystis sp.]